MGIMGNRYINLEFVVRFPKEIKFIKPAQISPCAFVFYHQKLQEEAHWFSVGSAHMTMIPCPLHFYTTPLPPPPPPPLVTCKDLGPSFSFSSFTYDRYRHEVVECYQVKCLLRNCNQPWYLLNNKCWIHSLKNLSLRIPQHLITWSWL